LLGSSQLEVYDEPNPIGVAPPTPGFTSFRDLTWASPSVFKLEGNKKHTKRRLMEEIGQKPPGMVLEPCKKMGFQLPTSSGEFTGFIPSTVCLSYIWMFPKIVVPQNGW